MRTFFFALLCVFAWSVFFRVGAAAPVPLRGVVEGFYGTPWTDAERSDMLMFCGRAGFNAYIYAPKDDLYHRERWREPYPEEALSHLETFVAEARANGIRFIFAVSPGLDLHLDGAEAAADQDAMLAKLESLYALGVRDFAIFFDDIQNKDGAGQAQFLHRVSREMHRRHADVSAFLTVPTEYDRSAMMEDDGTATPYTEAFSRTLDDDILVLYTGEGVAKGALTQEEWQEAGRCYGRPLGLWWNYPVNDYQETKLALGPMDALPLDGIPAIFFNPMKYERLSKIALATGADLAHAPERYDPDASWRAAIEAQYGDLAPAMTCFADHSTHLENHWADIGRADAPDMQKKIHAFRAAMEQDAPDFVKLERLRALEDACIKVQQAIARLNQELDAATLEECRPQLAQLGRIANADRTGLRLLREQMAGNDADLAAWESLRQEIALREGEARISDEAAYALLELLGEWLTHTPS